MSPSWRRFAPSSSTPSGKGITVAQKHVSAMFLQRSACLSRLGMSAPSLGPATPLLAVPGLGRCVQTTPHVAAAGGEFQNAALRRDRAMGLMRSHEFEGRDGIGSGSEIASSDEHGQQETEVQRSDCDENQQ